MCDVLKEVYSEVMGEKFSYELIRRIKLQKIVYLLENMGVHVGDYSFTWDKYGPYSIALDDDAYRCCHKKGKNEVVFTSGAKEAFEKIKNIISQRKEYDDVGWLECISSLHYLKFVLRVAEDDEGVLKELVNRKERLNNTDENKAALQYVYEVEMGM